MKRWQCNFFCWILMIGGVIGANPVIVFATNQGTTTLKIQAMACGDEHSLILLNDGTVWGCGANESRQLSDASRLGCRIPVQIPGLVNVTAIACGSKFSLALKKDGTVWGWGQICNGIMEISNVPAQIPCLKNINFIAAGGQQAFAVKKDGTVWGWGSNNLGQLGDGTCKNRKLPLKIKGLRNIKSIACGNGHTVALKTDGTLWVWGTNNSGQLGEGTLEDHLKPVKVPGLSDIMAVACGSEHTLALKKNGTILSWGANGSGQLGNGNKVNQLRPVLVTGIQAVAAIATGSNFNLAFKNDGSLWGWGSDVFGELGDVKAVESVDECIPCRGKNNVYYYDKPKPVPVKDGTDVAGIACGKSFSLMLKLDGTIWSWGVNSSGQLAEGSVIDRLAPTQNFYGRIIGKMIQPYQSIAAEEARARLDQEQDLMLLDVRTPEEYLIKHLQNSSLIPLDQLEKRIQTIIPDKSTPILVYCKKGSRSAKAADLLVRLGYQNVSNLLGGIEEWPFATLSGAQ